MEQPAYSVKEFFESNGTADGGVSRIIEQSGSKMEFYKIFYTMVTHKELPEIRNLEHLVLLLLEYVKAEQGRTGEAGEVIVINDKSGHKVGHASFIHHPNNEWVGRVICYYSGSTCEKIVYHEFMDKGTDVVGVFIEE